MSKINNTIMAAIDNGLCCSVCLDNFADEGEKVPVVVACGHSFCRGCVTLLPVHDDKCTCPLCRSDLPLTWADLGSRNVTAIQLLKQEKDKTMDSSNTPAVQADLSDVRPRRKNAARPAGVPVVAAAAAEAPPPAPPPAAPAAPEVAAVVIPINRHQLAAICNNDEKLRAFIKYLNVNGVLAYKPRLGTGYKTLLRSLALHLTRGRLWGTQVAARPRPTTGPLNDWVPRDRADLEQRYPTLDALRVFIDSYNALPEVQKAAGWRSTYRHRSNKYTQLETSVCERLGLV